MKIRGEFCVEINTCSTNPEYLRALGRTEECYNRLIESFKELKNIDSKNTSLEIFKKPVKEIPKSYWAQFLRTFE